MVIGSLVDAKRDAQDTSKCSDPCGGRIGLRGHCRTVRRERTGGCEGGGGPGGASVQVPQLLSLAAGGQCAEDANRRITPDTRHSLDVRHSVADNSRLYDDT